MLLVLLPATVSDFHYQSVSVFLNSLMLLSERKVFSFKILRVSVSIFCHENHKKKGMYACTVIELLLVFVAVEAGREERLQFRREEEN